MTKPSYEELERQFAAQEKAIIERLRKDPTTRFFGLSADEIQRLIHIERAGGWNAWTRRIEQERDLYKSDLARVRGLLQRYGSHTSQCAINQTRMVGAPWKQCDCGWTTDIYPILTDAMGNSLAGAESADIGKLDSADGCTHRRTTFIIDQSGTDPIVESLMCNDCLKRFEEAAGSAETGGEKA